jgi:alkylresorcinol/alkylpyrone synthase
MPRVISVGTCDAPYKLSQREAKEFVHTLFSNSKLDIERLITVFDNSTVSTRYISQPIAWYEQHHSLSERNRIFIETALELSQKAIVSCLEKINVHPEDLDHVIFVTSTGLSTPSIDAVLLNRLHFKKHIERTPIWGLGCAGGAVGLSRAYEYTKAYPEKTALVIAVELCSLTFQKDDISKSNVIATSLFSDGAAAVLITGDKHKLCTCNGIYLLDTLSTTYDNSLDVMGWDVIDTGFKVIFSRDIPTIVCEYIRPNIKELLDLHNLTFSDIKHYIAHPGGLKVIIAYQESIGLTNGAMDYAKKVLREHGNMSSPSVLYVLDEFLSTSNYQSGEYGLITALGPGFSSELILFKT